MNLQQDIWQSPSSFNLRKGEIHVWRVNLNQKFSEVSELFETLSGDEKQKAQKFIFEKDRNHFVAARGTLRKILSNYLSIKPNEIRFAYTRFGKPLLESGESQLKFNVSHSHELSLIAVTKGQEVGIDIEFIDSNFDLLKTAKCFFSKIEMSVLQNLPSNLQTPAFFSGWTRKEALIKGVGKGFSYPVNEFTISIKPEESNISLPTNEFQNWSLITLDCQTDYKAALAVNGKIQTLRFWQSRN